MTNAEAVSWIQTLVSGVAGALIVQLLVFRQTKKHSIQAAKMAVLQKIVGNRGAIVDEACANQRTSFFEGLNEILIVFSQSPEVSKALIDYKSSHTSDAVGQGLHKTTFITLIKAMSNDVGIKPTHLKDDLFATPFTTTTPWLT